MPVKCETIIEMIEQFAPKSLAEEWDNVGLQVGDPHSDVDRVLVALDFNGKVLQEAIECGVQMVIVHHPVVFKPLKHLRFDHPQTALLCLAIKHNLQLYAAHTNLDTVAGGVNDVLAQKLGLENIEILGFSGEEKLFKVVVFVPQNYTDAVRSAMAETGAGWIGNYSHCFFSTDGIGTFLPLEGSTPFLGRPGSLERVNETRLETIVPEQRLKKVINAMLKAHPYEEVAYDLYPLANRGRAYGLGRVGYLSASLNLADFAALVKTRLGACHVRVVGDQNTVVKKVAVCGGAGISLLNQAAAKGADVLVTGDVKYHDAQEALARGICLIDAGHRATELPVVERLADYLKARTEASGLAVQVYISQANGEPFTFV